MIQQNLPFELFGQTGVKYICQQLIGVGTQGQVYKAIREDQPQLKVAIKLTQDIRDDELQFLYNLQKTSIQYKHIIKYYEVIDNTKNTDVQTNSQQKNYCFIMELGSKNILEDVIQSNKYSEIQKIEIICQIAYGIQELHSLKQIHRDIKPENIIQVGDVWKLCDFGFIKHKTSQNKTQLVGTPYYIAPEVFLQKSDSSIQYDNKVDIWSFGCIIYEIFTSNLFFQGNQAEQVTQQIEIYTMQQESNPRDQNTDQRFQNLHNKELQVLCKCMMTVNPQERYDTNKVVEELNKINASYSNKQQIPIFQQNSSGQNNLFGGNIQKIPNLQSQIPFSNLLPQNPIDSKFSIQSPPQMQINNNQLIQPSTLQNNSKQQQLNNMQNIQTLQKVNPMQNQQNLQQQNQMQNQQNLPQVNLMQNQQSLLQLNPMQNQQQNPLQNQQQNPMQNQQQNPMQNQQLNPMQNQQLNPIQNQQLNPMQNQQQNLMQNQQLNPMQNQQLNPMQNQQQNLMQNQQSLLQLNSTQNQQQNHMQNQQSLLQLNSTQNQQQTHMQNQQTLQKVNPMQNQQNLQQLNSTQNQQQNQQGLLQLNPTQGQQTLPKVNPIQNQQSLQSQNQMQNQQSQLNTKQQFSNQKNQLSQPQFQISNQQPIIPNIPKQNQQTQNINILNSQKVDSTQNFQQNHFLQINKDNNDFISKYLDQIIKPEYKSELMTFILNYPIKIQTNSIDNTQDMAQIKENLIQILIQFIQNKVQII